MTDQERKDIRPDNLYTDTVETLAHGSTAMLLNTKLRKCIEAAKKTGKTASLNLLIKIKPNGDDGQCILSDQIKAVVPEMDSPTTIIFTDEENNFTKEHPSIRAKRLAKEKAAAEAEDNATGANVTSIGKGKKS